MTKNQETILGFSSGLKSTISEPVTHTWERERGGWGGIVFNDDLVKAMNVK